MDNRTMITEIDTKEKLEIDRDLKNELMKDLSPDDLSKIKRGFDLYRGVVDLKQFIIVILYALYPQITLNKRKTQILTFIEMFILIDLKNLGKIKFQDFTNYLIDRQSSESKAQESQFFPAQDLNQLNLQADVVFPLANSKLLAVLQNSKKNVNLLQAKSYKVAEHLSFGGTIINNIIFIHDEEVYCIATNDKHLNFYESTDNSLVRRFSTPDSISFMIYFQQTNKIITASTNGHIYEWSSKKILANMKKKQKTESEKEKLPKVPSQEQYKLFLLNKIIRDQDDLTCLDILDSLQILVTGSNDSKVRLYDIRQTGLKLNKQLDGHYKGIKGVTVSVHHKVIVSCSFDFDVLVWNAYLEHPVARLQGHQAPLMSVYCPKEHDIIISIDSKSVMKIWNSEKYHLIQNIVIFQNNPINSAIRLCYKEQSNLAIIYTKRLYFYKYAVNYNPRLTDDQDITAIKYSAKNLQVYIGSLTSLKIWSIQTGLQKRNYLNVVDSQITVIEIDQRDRRCFIGCMDGKIVSLDLFSGLIIQRYSAHKNQISFLLYNNEHNLLISGSWDKRIKIHNDTHHLEKIQSRQNVLRNIVNVSEKDLFGGSFSVQELLIATHCKTNAFKLWDFEKGHLQAKYLLPSDICLIQFIRPFPLLLVSDVKGSIYIFSTKNYIQNPFALLAQWKSMYSIQKTSQISFIKPLYNDKTKECQIILGDEYGYIRIINITGFLEENNINPITPELLGNKNPYRIEDYYYKGVSQLSTMTHDFTKSTNPNLIPPTSIKQRIQIKAHNERINYVTLINESKEPLILSSSSDHMVKLWNLTGESRGTLRQGQKVNSSWGYNLNEQWQNIECKLYKQIKGELEGAEQDYLFKKRVDMIPFTEAERFEEITNDDIYQTLKEIDKYTEKGKKQIRY